MTAKVGRTDCALLPALVVMVVMLMAAAYVSGELTMLRIVNQDAPDAAGIWRDHPGGIRAGTAAEPGTASVTPSASVAARFLAGLSDATVLDSAGHSRGVREHASQEPFRFLSATDRHAFERTVATGAAQQYLPANRDGTGGHTIYYVPIQESGSVAGAVRLEIDQTGTAALLRNVSRSVLLLTLALSALGILAMLYVLWRRIKDGRSTEDRLRFVAHHDTLTSLPNRTQFQACIATALERAARDDSRLAVMCIDVDAFKDVNDTLGHDVGDQVLCLVAERLMTAAPRGATVARLSGDEFAIVVENVAADEARQIVRGLIGAFGEIEELAEHDVMVSVGIGATLAPRDGRDAETLLRSAQLALHQAKSAGRNKFRFYTREMDEALRQRRNIEAHMRKALGSSQFEVHYQPQFHLASGRLAGFEALARWHHPQLGAIPPSVFIPLAEESGLIGELGLAILRSACRAATEWPMAARLAVNLSVAQFQSGDIAATIEQVLEETGLPASRLEVEITETLLLTDTEHAVTMLNRLRGLGISIALDDFGTGYSSLGYLSRFPFDKIKIDRSFIQRLTTEPSAAAIVEAVVALGSAIGATVTAEGVETQEQVAMLRSAGCHHVQGYLFGRPLRDPEMPVPEIIRLQDKLARAVG